jgi:exodeoxyribonuclease V gamma subunit
MLRLTESNRLEALAERLVAALDVRSSTPLVPETVVVPNFGMARWLSLAIARAHGVCANVRFVLPAAFVWEVLGRVVGPRAEIDVFDPAVLAWRVFEVLGRLEPEPRFAALAEYVATPSDRPRYELARRIAGVFDQYLVYRPDWIRCWEAGGDRHWQAELWRGLVAGRREAHRVHLLDALVAALERGPLPQEALPHRVLVFGVSALPPAYVAVLGRLAATLDVDAYLLAPSPEYARELVTAGRLAQLSLTFDAEREHFEVGNPLLAGLGRQGAEFRDVVGEWNPHTIDAWVPPDDATILGAVQADVYALEHRGSVKHPATPRPDDGSIQVHACHGPMREVEVLHDQLLAIFDRHPALAPPDVVVMMPDVETYAPCIEAVFGTAPRERFIPYTIADRSLRAERPLVDAFLALLELPESRYDANRILALVDVAAVRRRFGFTETDVARAHRWVREAGIRWGVDGEGRAALGLPEIVEHTWRFGLDRLLLGYAMVGDGRRRFADVLPYDDVEGTSARAAGLLATLAEACFALRAALGAPRPAAGWVAALGGLVERFFAPSRDDEEDVATIRRALGDLEQTTRRAGLEAPLSRDVVRAHLEGALAAPLATGRFLAGKVTFCALVPMRSIPFAVVCLLGMDDGSYPRPRRPLGFDLMADDYRPGDRSRREDDRHLFLEALLSARRVLYASYTGFDVRDGGERQPSVLVADLVRCVREGFGLDVVRKHPLQPFAARYFTGDDRVFSHADDLCRARRVQGTRAEPSAPFVLRPLAEPDASWRTIALDDLVQFYRGPARFFVRERLGVRLEPARGEVETREPFVLGSLERYRLCEEVVRLRRADVPIPDVAALVRGAGLLPHGVVGDVALEAELAEVEGLVARLRAIVPERGTPAAVVDVELGGFRVHGALVRSSLGGIVDFRPTSAKPGDRLGLWLRHLALACVVDGGESRWLGLDGTVVLRPVDEPRALLEDLLALYWEGLRRPLPFFPRSAYAACDAKGDPLDAARKRWDPPGTDFVDALPGESEDPYNALAFRGHDPIDAEFLATARRVLVPLREHQRDETA